MVSLAGHKLKISKDRKKTQLFIARIEVNTKYFQSESFTSYAIHAYIYVLSKQILRKSHY